MKRNHIASIATAFTLTLAAGAAFAQVTNGPDFSPMRPGNYEELRTQSTAPAEPAYAPPAYDAPANPPQNRMLEAYESSAAPVDTIAAAPYAQPAHPRVAVAPPRQSTIGNGLFDRRGPNDFGA